MKKRTITAIPVVLWLGCFLFAQAPSGPAKIQTLIITGQNGHDWRGTTPLLRKALEDTGRFAVRTTEEFRGAGPETLAPYDLVVLNYYELKKPELRWGERADNALLDFARSGQGHRGLPLFRRCVRGLGRVRETLGRQLEARERPPLGGS